MGHDVQATSSMDNGCVRSVNVNSLQCIVYSDDELSGMIS